MARSFSNAKFLRFRKIIEVFAGSPIRGEVLMDRDTRTGSRDIIVFIFVGHKLCTVAGSSLDYEHEPKHPQRD